MYAGLGFVGGGSRPPENRDAHFTGSSGHLSKRNFSHSQKKTMDNPMKLETNNVPAFPNGPSGLGLPPSEPSAPLTEHNTLIQRYNFLESQFKKSSGEIADLHANINDMKRDQKDMNTNSFKVTVTATRKLKMIQCHEDELIHLKNNENKYEWSEKNQDFLVCYPMKEINDDEVWMKSIIIDKDLGSMQYVWIQIANKEEGRGVHNFRF